MDNAEFLSAICKTEDMGTLVSSEVFFVLTHYHCHVGLEGGCNLPLPDEDRMPRDHSNLLSQRYIT